MNDSLIKFGALLFVSFVAFNAQSAVAGEITDKEWHQVRSTLTVTYFAGSDTRVSCTAYNSAEKAIGGGESNTYGGVARVNIRTPDKYKGKDLKVTCR